MTIQAAREILDRVMEVVEVEFAGERDLVGRGTVVAGWLAGSSARSVAGGLRVAALRGGLWRAAAASRLILCSLAGSMGGMIGMRWAAAAAGDRLDVDEVNGRQQPGLGEVELREAHRLLADCERSTRAGRAAVDEDVRPLDLEMLLVIVAGQDQHPLAVRRKGLEQTREPDRAGGRAPRPAVAGSDSNHVTKARSSARIRSPVISSTCPARSPSPVSGSSYPATRSPSTTTTRPARHDCRRDGAGRIGSGRSRLRSPAAA